MSSSLGGGYLWVIVGGHGPLFGDDRVARVDLGTNQVASVLQLHHSATSIAFGYGSAWIGTYTSGGNSCCGPHLLEWDASLFTQRGEVEVDLLAGHQPLAERHDIRERHRESYRRPERRQASRHGSSRGGFPTPRRRRRRKPWPRPREQDQEMQKRTASRRPLSQRTGPRFGDRPASFQETVGYEGLEDRLDVASRFRFAVSLEETKHLGAVHRHSDAAASSVQTKTFAKTLARLT